MRGSFDVFFSYHTVDHAIVTQVAQRLHDRGIRVFLDRWYLAAGQPWPQALEQALASCGAVAVFLGAEGLGPWQQRERDLALYRQGREPGFPVIPVLLSRMDPALGFLRLNTWVDLSAGAEEEALETLTAAIRRQPPGPLTLQRIEAVRADVCPYRGLHPFREEDEPFFFGRAAFTETLAAAIARQPFVAVVGASGSGKSSVVRAGLIPRLRRGEGGFVWDVVTFVPSDRPLVSLAAALLPFLEPDLSEVDGLAEANKLAAHLADGSVALRDVSARILQKQRGTDRLLLFIDQWEELYTLCPDQQICRNFAAQLLDAAAAGSVKVVLTIRGDFFGRALADRALSDQLQDAVVTIGPMTRGELAEAILKPAAAVGLAFEAGLDETILDDVGDEPGSLPLLEFLLEALWRARHDALLHYDAYHRLGRVPGAIAHRAEELFERALTEAERQAAHRLLICMVHPGEGTQDTRQRVTIPEADPVAEATIRKLADARLLVTERDAATGRETVEVAHEALIRGWQRLRGWVDQDREFLRTRERIAAQAKLWENEGRPPDRLLPPGRPLAEGEDVLTKRREDLGTRLIAFIETSIGAEKARQEVERAVQRRRLRTARLAALAMACLALIALGVGVYAYNRSAEANRQRDQALRTQSLFLADLSRQELKKGHTGTAIRLALKALPSPESADRPYVRDAELVLYEAVAGNLERIRFLGHEKAVAHVAFDPDGRRIATASWDNTARLWDAGTGMALRTLTGHQGELHSAAFSPDGRLIVTASEDKTARVWDAATGMTLRTLIGHEGGVLSAAFSPDGRRIVTASADKTARLWDAETGMALRTLTGHEGWVWSAAFSPDGRRIVTASEDKTARLWDAETGMTLRTLTGHQREVHSAAFSPDGRCIVTASADKTARLWDAETGMALRTLTGHEGWVWSAAFSLDGRRIVTASADKMARLWDAETGAPIRTLTGHQEEVYHAVFSPDGRRIVTASWDKTARLWAVARKATLRTLIGHEDSVRSAAFSPDGRWIVTASFDKTARLWDAETGMALRTLTGHEGWVWSAAFSPDGRRIVTASADKTARLWDAETGMMLRTLTGHEGGVLSAAFSPDGRCIVTASQDKTARLWDAETGMALRTLTGHEGWVWSAAFSSDGRRIVTASQDKTARLWDAETGTALRTLTGHNGAVVHAAFSPDGRRIVTASEDKTARLWDAETGMTLRTLTGHQREVHSAAFSPDGRRIITASWDGTAQLWDAESGMTLRTLTGHEEEVYHAAFSPTGRRVVTASRDHTVRIWPVLEESGMALIDLAHRQVPQPLSCAEREFFSLQPPGSCRR